MKVSDSQKKNEAEGGGKRGSLVAQTGGNNYPSPAQRSQIYASPIKVSGWDHWSDGGVFIGT